MLWVIFLLPLFLWGQFLFLTPCGLLSEGYVTIVPRQMLPFRRARGRCPSPIGLPLPWASRYMMWSGTWGSLCGKAQRSMTSGIPLKIFLKTDAWKRWREKQSCLGWQNMSNTRHLEFSHIALIEKKLYLEELWRLHLWLWHLERIWWEMALLAEASSRLPAHKDS